MLYLLRHVVRAWYVFIQNEDYSHTLLLADFFHLSFID